MCWWNNQNFCNRYPWLFSRRTCIIQLPLIFPPIVPKDNFSLVINGVFTGQMTTTFLSLNQQCQTSNGNSEHWPNQTKPTTGIIWSWSTTDSQGKVTSNSYYAGSSSPYPITTSVTTGTNRWQNYIPQSRRVTSTEIHALNWRIVLLITHVAKTVRSIQHSSRISSR